MSTSRYSHFLFELHDGWLVRLARTSANEKMAAFLIDMLERHGAWPTIELPMPRRDIGDHLGLTLETVSRRLRVLDLPAMRAIAG